MTAARRYVVNRSDRDAAARIRETFVDRKVEKTIPISWTWPRSMICVGQSEAVQYTSDKWKKPGNYEDYKHVAEGPQRLFVKPGFLVDYSSGKKMDFPHEKETLPRRMPEAIAELAPILGLQFQPYNDALELSGKYYSVDIKRAFVGAAEMPGTGEVFLMIYTKTELCAIITGDILNVEKDGIVG